MPRKPFRKRTPLPIGAASLVILLLLMAASLNIKDLPLIGQGSTYTARFSESAGVQPDDDVRVAGIRVGTVTDLTLEGTDVLISFKAPDAWIGDQTSASIEIKTVLGQKYIQLEPAGDRPLDPDSTSRGSAPGRRSTSSRRSRSSRPPSRTSTPTSSPRASASCPTPSTARRARSAVRSTG